MLLFSNMGSRLTQAGVEKVGRVKEGADPAHELVLAENDAVETMETGLESIS
jgi:hypothetical protein